MIVAFCAKKSIKKGVGKTAFMRLFIGYKTEIARLVQLLFFENYRIIHRLAQCLSTET